MYYLQNATASDEQLEKVVVVLCHVQEQWQEGGQVDCRLVTQVKQAPRHPLAKL